jgi:hypothetical protein
MKRLVHWRANCLSGAFACLALGSSAVAQTCPIGSPQLAVSDCSGFGGNVWLYPPGATCPGGGAPGCAAICPEGIAYGPDVTGDGVPELFVANYFASTIDIYDGANSCCVASFYTNNPSTPLLASYPYGIAFGPDLTGDGIPELFLADWNAGSVFSYDVVTRAFFAVFVPYGSGGLTSPDGLAFGPNGDLYVTDRALNAVLRFNGLNGTFVNTFVQPGSGGLSGPRGIAFGPDGSLYLSSFDTNQVLRYGPTGAFASVFVSNANVTGPWGVAFGPEDPTAMDNVPELYVASSGSGQVLTYNGATGAFIRIYQLGLSGPTYLAWAPQSNVTRPTVFAQLNRYSAAIATSDPVNACVRLVNGPNPSCSSTPCRVDAFGWLRPPTPLPDGRRIARLFVRRELTVPVNLNRMQTFPIGRAGLGLLANPGRYVFGVRVVDSTTGAALSSVELAFNVF